MSILLNQQHAWVFVLVLAGLVFAALRLYRRVPPTVTPAQRALLLALRTAALAVVTLVLLEPVIRQSGARTERPTVAVLLDTSKSMSTEDGTGGMPRGEEAVELLNQVVLPRVARDADVRAFGFDSELTALRTDGASLSDVPAFDGEVTDIPEALSELKREIPEGVAAIVIATDGANNHGGSVVDAWRPLGAPVYALGVGSEIQTKDIAVREVLTNRISYAGEALPIEATVSSSGFGGGETTAELLSDGQVLERSVLELSGTGEESILRFSTVPSSPGVHRYEVRVPPLPGEITDANNSRIVATNVLGGKIKALLVASGPGWDYAFTRRELESDDNIDLSSYALLEGSDAGGRERAPRSVEELLAYDVVILVDPGGEPQLLPWEWLDRFVRERGGGLLVIGSGAGHAGAPHDLIPLEAARRLAEPVSETRLGLTASGESSPLTRLVDGRFENSSLWRALPPVWVELRAGLAAVPDASALVEARDAEGVAEPVMAEQRVGAGSVVALAASGIWRWKMAGPEDEDVLDIFIANAVRWLTARGELSRVTVTTDESVYPAGAAVRFSAQVYRGDYRLARDATVSVDVATSEGAAPTESVVLSPQGDFYRGQVGPLSPGRYVYRAEALVGDERMGEDSGEFLVEAFSLEDAETRRRPGALRRLADESGGMYVAPESTDDLPESVPLERRTIQVRRELELWNSPWPLIIIVGLLSVEWAVRRSKGMP